MTQVKCIWGIGAVLFLVLLPMVLSTHAAASPQGASLAALNAAPAQIPPKTQLSAAVKSEVIHLAPYAGEIRRIIAQSEIPDVLIPSVVPSVEPTLFVSSPTAQPTAVSTNTSSSTAAASTGTGVSLDKIIGSISPFFIIALIPLLFVIGALFYFFFMGDHYRGAPDEEQQADAELSDAVEDAEWREL